MGVFTYNTKKGKRWRVQYTIKDNFGKRRTVGKRGFQTEREAKAYNIELGYKLHVHGDDFSYVTLRLAYEDYLLDKEKQVRIATLNKIKQMSEDYILSYLGNTPISKITTGDIIRWKREIDDFGFSLKHNQRIFTRFNAIIKHAMLRFDIKENVLERVGTFTAHAQNSIKRRVIIWEEKDTIKFLNAFDLTADEVYYCFFATEIYTGMRNCEAFALRWHDIDFQNKRIHINKSLSQKVKGTRIHEENTKTLKSNRSIKINDELKNILYQHFKNVKRLYNFSMDWFVFGNELPIAETTMNKRRVKYCQLANVPIISCHKIRHTHISHLLNSGASPLAVSSRVGHASTRMTLDVYGHTIENADDEIIEIINHIYKEVEINE